MTDAAPAGAPGDITNKHGFMAFGISSMALMLGTAGVGLISVMSQLGLSPLLYRACNVASYAVPIGLAALGIRHGVMAFVLAKRGIPCYKESEFAAFLGIMIGIAVAGIFIWFGLTSHGPARHS